MASDYTVGDLVAEFLSACGVTTVFGIASVHNIPMLDAIGRRNTIRFMMARGELGGAHMADGYARVAEGLGLSFPRPGQVRRPPSAPCSRPVSPDPPCCTSPARHRPDTPTEAWDQSTTRSISSA